MLTHIHAITANLDRLMLVPGKRLCPLLAVVPHKPRRLALAAP